MEQKNRPAVDMSAKGGSAGKELLQLLCLFFKRLLFCSVVSSAYFCGCFLLLSGIGGGDNLSGTLNYLLRELVCFMETENTSFARA